MTRQATPLERGIMERAIGAKIEELCQGVWVYGTLPDGYEFAIPLGEEEPRISVTINENTLLYEEERV